MLRELAGHGVERIKVGMAHRGRLNVLVHLLGKPLGALCSEMEGQQSEFKVGGEWVGGAVGRGGEGAGALRWREGFMSRTHALRPWA